MTAAPKLATLAEVRDLATKADTASRGPWSWMPYGEKGDGGAHVGIAFAPDDHDAERQLSGKLPECDADGNIIAYYFDGEVAHLEHGGLPNDQGGGPYQNADFIAACRDGVPALCATVERLAHGMQDVAAWLSDYDQMPEGGAKASMKGANDLALALLTQLGATP